MSPFSQIHLTHYLELNKKGLEERSEFDLPQGLIILILVSFIMLVSR